MCYEFEKTGKCKYGDKCAYSHDRSAVQEKCGKDDGTDGKRFVKKAKITCDKKTSSKKRTSTEAKDRKEKSLRKKVKGWRNK